MPNADQAAAWDGPEGEYWATNRDVYEASGLAQRARLLEVAAIGSGERVLDVGCGTGVTTLAAARATSAEVLGVDLSRAMLAVAAEQADYHGLANARFERADAQVHDFPQGAFDVAISAFGVMFFEDPVAAFANVRSALAPGGRLVVAVWRDAALNGWAGRPFAALTGNPLPVPPPGAPSPFSLGDEDRLRSVLTGAGFTSVELEPVDAPVSFGPDADRATEFLTGRFRALLAEYDDDARARAVASLRATIEEHATADGVLFPAASWVVSAR